MAGEIHQPADDEQALKSRGSAAAAADAMARADRLLRLSSELGGATSKEAIAQRLVKALDEFWEWDACWVSMRRLGRDWFRTLVQVDTIDGERKSWPGSSFEAAKYRHFGNLMQGEPLLDNRAAHPDRLPTEPFGNETRLSASRIFASMQHGGRSMGIISVQSYTPEKFDAADAELLQRIANIAAPSVKRCMEERRSASLASLGRRLSSAVTSLEAGHVIAEVAQELLGWDAFRLDLYDSKADTCEVVLNIDTIDGRRMELFPHEQKLRPSPLTRKVLADKPRLILRSEHDEEMEESHAYGDVSRRAESILYAPIHGAEPAIGVLSLQSYTNFAYTDEDLQTLQLLAAHCAGALERTAAQKALQQSEERFRSVVQSLGEGLLLTDMADVVQYVNQRFLELSGYSEQELVGKPAYEMLLRSEDHEAMRQRLGEREQGRSSRYTTEMRKKSGEPFWVDVSGTPLHDADGHVIGTIGAMTDVTERRRNEHTRAVLSEFATQLAATGTLHELGEIAERTVMRLWDWDAFFLSLKGSDGQYRAVVATDTFMGERVHWPGAGDNLNHLPQDHPIRRGEFVILNRTEQEISDLPRYGDVDRVSKSLLFAPLLLGQQLLGVISVQSYTAQYFREEDLDVLRRIAEILGPSVARCVAEEAARQSEAELRSLFSAMTDIIVVYDEDCRYVKVAPTKSPRLQSLAEPLVGKTVYEIMPLEVAQRIHQYVRTCLSTRRPLVLEYRAGAGSSEAWFSATVGPLTDHTVVFVAHDITERMRTAKTRGVLAKLGEQLSACTTPSQVGAAVLQAADELFGWDAAYLNAVGPDGRLSTLIKYDIVDGTRQEIHSPPARMASPDLQFVFEQGPQLILRGEEDQPQQPLVAFGDSSRPSASLMFVPIRRGTEKFGVLSIQSYTPELYSEEDLRLLQLLADYCSSALNRTFIEAELRQSEERLRLLVTQMPVITWTTDLDLRMQLRGGTNFERLGLPTVDPGHATLHEYFETHDDNFPPIAMHRRALEGKSGSFELAWKGRYLNGFVEPLKSANGEIVGTVCVAHDVTERVRVEMQLRHGAFHDTLTDLPNRAMFMDWLNRALAHTQRRPSYKFAVLFMDLDRFKHVNDTLGHNCGDQLLVLVADRLRTCLRAEDMVARLGGDEFAIFVDDIDDVNSAVTVTEKILKEISQPFMIGTHEVFTNASVGVAISSSGYEKPDDLLRDADAAMYRAKEAGKGRYEIFDAAMHAHVMELAKLESELRIAIERQEFLLYYQPIVSLRNGLVVGFEALLRWMHPQRGLLCGPDFLHVAEDSGLIVPIGHWAMRDACKRMQTWQRTRSVRSGATISVNVSARQFREENFVQQVQSVLEESGLAPQSLKLEVKESVLMEDPGARSATVQELKKLQVQIYVDDFGTGASSLPNLSRFPIDALKIHDSFVRDLATNEDSLQIVRTTVAMAHTLGMEAIAEGVETAEQLMQLKALGCKLGQGHYFSPAQEGTKAGVQLGEQWRVN